jgi:hypothetical protein
MSHDLNSKLNTVEKWLKKFYEVRVVINADDGTQKAEAIANDIESKTVEFGKLVQKRTKDGNTLLKS